MICLIAGSPGRLSGATSPFLSFSVFGFSCEWPSTPLLTVINGSIVERSPPGVGTGDGTDTISYFIYLHAIRRTISPDSAPPTRIYEVWRGKRSFPLVLAPFRDAPSVSVCSNWGTSSRLITMIDRDKWSTRLVTAKLLTIRRKTYLCQAITIRRL